MSGDIRAFFFHQITGQEESGCKSFLSGLFSIVVRYVTCVGKLYAVCSSVGMRAWLLGRLVLCSCPNATHDEILSRGLGADSLFKLSLTILLSRLDLIGSKKLWRGKLLIGWKKKDLFNWKYKVIFQPNGCAEPTCAAMCFLHFGLRQHPAFEMYVRGVLFVCLFIVFASELVWNVLVNQKGFLHITDWSTHVKKNNTYLLFLWQA